MGDDMTVEMPSMLGKAPVISITRQIRPDHGAYFRDSLRYHSIENILIPSSVECIGEWAFVHCSSLKSVVFPESVKTIRGYAFAGCSSLESIVIPDSVKHIGRSAFRGCSSLSSVVLPATFTGNVDEIFEECPLLDLQELKNFAHGKNEKKGAE